MAINIVHPELKPETIAWLKSKEGRKKLREGLQRVTEDEERLQRARYPWLYGDRSVLNI